MNKFYRTFLVLTLVTFFLFSNSPLVFSQQNELKTITETQSEISQDETVPPAQVESEDY